MPETVTENGKPTVTSSRAVLIRGVGEVASAVALRLRAGGMQPVLHQGPEAPLAHRRRMSFADAWFDGAATLEGVAACRLDDAAGLAATLGEGAAIPLLTCSFEAALAAGGWAALVDARMRKRAQAEDQRGLAPLVIGCGPGFVAGGSVDLAVETSWGGALGQVVRTGATQALAGEPRPIAGVGRERLVYAPCAGSWKALKEIGEAVAPGETAAALAGRSVAAPIAGTVRGTVRSGVAVPAGAKVLEIDPRPPGAARFTGLGERPRRIAEGVAEALSETAAATRSA